ncbi:hypothetical protein PHK61_08220 [Actinomycetospora lutea]|uniref:hypothetical protein n=1 Tax=Actinomycetospora lutea TaxID=663604 RepID=UPI002366E0F1|nr:hypothetical protein [Actinomycetospora lutea]MDD7938403.1 hypothetical protein [Actinomycetospora lutea]
MTTLEISWARSSIGCSVARSSTSASTTSTAKKTSAAASRTLIDRLRRQSGTDSTSEHTSAASAAHIQVLGPAMTEKTIQGTNPRKMAAFCTMPPAGDDDSPSS